MILKEMEKYKIITGILKCYAYSNEQKIPSVCRQSRFRVSSRWALFAQHFEIITRASSLFARLFEKNQIYKNNPRRFETFVLLACTKILLGK